MGAVSMGAESAADKPAALAERSFPTSGKLATPKPMLTPMTAERMTVRSEYFI
jgi:hypothetical protein